MLDFHGLTDIGRRRRLNEDCIVIGNGLFVVCDGMGGHNAGDVASRAAADVIAGFVKRSQEDPELTWPYGFDPAIPYDANRLRTAIKLANRTVYRKAASSDHYTGMGTTVAAALVSPTKPRLTYGHVGDSRIYLIRAGQIRQLTRDDSLANLTGFEDAIAPEMRNVLTKAIGAREDVQFDIEGETLEDGDAVLICSDGLTNMVPDPSILEIVSAHGRDVKQTCDTLVSSANAAGGRDNISVILLRYTA
jgi:protein phosphatase